MHLERSSLQFLIDLKENNNRDWFADHKSNFVIAQDNAKALYGAVRKGLEQHDEVERFKLLEMFGFLRIKHLTKPTLQGLFLDLVSTCVADITCVFVQEKAF